MTRNEYEQKIIEVLDSALNELSPEAFQKLIDNIGFILQDYE